MYGSQIAEWNSARQRGDVVQNSLSDQLSTATKFAETINRREVVGDRADEGPGEARLPQSTNSSFQCSP